MSPPLAALSDQVFSNLVPFGLGGDHRLDGRRGRQGQQGTDHAEDSRASDHGPESHRHVQLHGVGGDPGGEQVVLELLVDGYHDYDP